MDAFCFQRTVYTEQHSHNKHSIYLCEYYITNIGFMACYSHYVVRI